MNYRVYVLIEVPILDKKYELLIIPIIYSNKDD